MNNAKMWLVVPPAVGVPIFLGAVAVGSFAVHVAVLSKVNWYNNYLVGEELSSTEASAQLLAPQSDTAKASYAVPQQDGSLQVTIILPDGTSTQALIQPSQLQPQL